jgi:ATP-binding cassette subfamily B protein
MSLAQQQAASLPAWRVVLAMLRFRFRFWLLDLASVVIFRLTWHVAPGLIMQAFFDLLTDQAQVGVGIWTVVAYLMASELGRVIARYGFVWADVPLFAHITTLLRRNMLGHILNRPGAMALPESPGEAISRFRDDVNEIPLFVIWINDTLVGLLVVVLALVLMLRVNVPITLLALAPLTVIGVVANMASRRISAYRRASRQATGDVTGFIGELFGAAQAVKVNTAEGPVIAHFEGLNNRRRRAMLRERLFTALFDSLFRNTFSLGTGLMLILAGRAMRAGTFTVGDFALFVYLLGNVSDLSTFVGMVVARYRQLGVSIERMGHLMASGRPDALIEPGPVYMDGRFPEVSCPAKSAEDRLETLAASNLTYRYPGTTCGIEGVDLYLKRGEVIVITGEVGSGKTTLLRVLLGLLPPDAGEVRWNGRLVMDPGAFFVPPRSGYTAQVPRLFSWPLRDNILMGLEPGEEHLAHIISLAVLEDDLSELEDGLETVVGPKGVKLSGGQIQRAAAARMFARTPELLVLDDLSSALDVETERTLWERLLARDGATCLIVSHRRAVMRAADRVIVLRAGRVQAEGRLDDLLAGCEEMRRLWGGGLATAVAGKARAEDGTASTGTV